MALTGTFERSLDEKFRVAVPRGLKEAFPLEENGELYLAPGNEGCLSVYAPHEFDEFAHRLASVSPGRANVRTFLRLFYARAERVIADKQSRIRIPDRLLEYGHLQRNVVLLGVNDHVEIWDKETWESFLTQHDAQFDDLTTEALDLNVFEPPRDG